MRISRIIPAAALLLSLGVSSETFGGEPGACRAFEPVLGDFGLSTVICQGGAGVFVCFPEPGLNGARRAGMPDAVLRWGAAHVCSPVYILPLDVSAGCAAQAGPWGGEAAGRGAIRVAPHILSSLRGIFSRKGLPAGLVWIAEVESGFDPRAESSAGAVGLFQLMPTTAERFGLKIWPLDDRKTPEKSAEAAATYLRFLRDEFGSWPLALAAYNAGEGRVSRAMKRNGARTFSEVAAYLPSETRQYVPRVMAVMALREDQARGVPSAFFLP